MSTNKFWRKATSREPLFINDKLHEMIKQLKPTDKETVNNELRGTGLSRQQRRFLAKQIMNRGIK